MRLRRKQKWQLKLGLPTQTITAAPLIIGGRVKRHRRRLIASKTAPTAPTAATATAAPTAPTAATATAAPTASTAPTATAAPTAPTAPTASTAPAAPTAPTAPAAPAIMVYVGSTPRAGELACCNADSYAAKWLENIQLMSVLQHANLVLLSC